MDRGEAEAWNQKTRDYLIKMSQELDIQEIFVSWIMERNLEIIPEISKKNMILLGTDSFSLKTGNIKLDMKCLMMAGAELFASVSVPENVFNYIQLALLAFMFAAKVAIKKLNKDCSVVVYALDQLNAYDFYVDEERLKMEADETCEEKGREAISDLTEAINQLLEMHVIRMRDGKIALNESVWGEI